jgi:hypothetical protein
MTQCPKCGGSDIRGPFYHDGGYPYHEECLIYRCQCGYVQTRPCCDSTKPRVKTLAEIAETAKGGKP